jgi:hypothetical protein
MFLDSRHEQQIMKRVAANIIRNYITKSRLSSQDFPVQVAKTCFNGIFTFTDVPLDCILCLNTCNRWFVFEFRQVLLDDNKYTDCVNLLGKEDVLNEGQNCNTWLLEVRKGRLCMQGIAVLGKGQEVIC